MSDKPWEHLNPRGKWQMAWYVYGTHHGADRVLRAVYVWCAMAASAAKAWEDAGHYHGC